MRFATIAHELGHLALGHLGRDKSLGVPDRKDLSHGQEEVEAESVSYLVCARNGIRSKSETYLANYVAEKMTIEDVDLYQIARAAGLVETLLGLTAETKWDKPPARVVQREMVFRAEDASAAPHLLQHLDEKAMQATP